jgi:hypothetical protein
LQREIVTNSDNGEWPVLTFQLKAEDVDVEIHAGGYFIDVEYQVIDRSHAI